MYLVIVHLFSFGFDMRLISTIALLFLLSSVTFAQNENLPEILKPNAASQAAAQRLGAKVLKLLPYKVFNKWPWRESVKNESNPSGLSGGGSFYSFTNQSHSFNRKLEIRRLANNAPVSLTITRRNAFKNIC